MGAVAPCVSVLRKFQSLILLAQEANLVLIPESNAAAFLLVSDNWLVHKVSLWLTLL